VCLQEDDLKAITDEMRKLKAIIVKHENRIRALEAAQKAREEEELEAKFLAATTPNVTSNNKSESDTTAALAPDEV
jgi:coronin-1B/1C/6